MKYKWIEEAESTNSLLKSAMGNIEPMTMLLARSQTAGRGQRGNSWEAEPGKNLTLSFYFNPKTVKPAEQFVVSEAVALAVVDFLRLKGIEAMIKWPNDIYTGNRKICGILIENAVMGDKLAWSIAGVGLNVNQTEFRSGAPNPVSMKMITGREYPLPDCARLLGECMERRLEQISSPAGLHRDYIDLLWWRDGELHPFHDTSTGEDFFAEIIDIEPSGHLILKGSDSRSRRYAFKEVSFLL